MFYIGTLDDKKEQKKPLVSVIIPTHNESATIAETLQHVKEVLGDLCEIVVVDSSHDSATIDVAKPLARQACSVEHRYRAYQMNFGARLSRGRIFLFLHADTRLPKSAREHLLQFSQSEQYICGAFTKQFDYHHPFLGSIAAVNNFSLKYFNSFLGDNAFFIKKDAFLACGQFPDQKLMEDVEMSKLIKRCLKKEQKQFYTITDPVHTSARKFQNYGVFRTFFLMQSIRMRYALGASAEDLFHQYYKQRKVCKLIMFAKYPQKGHVKTRLAAKVGAESAVGYYKQFLHKLIKWHKKQSYQFYVSLDHYEKKASFAQEFELQETGIIQQPQGDLGERMYQTFKQHTEDGAYVVLIGSDTPSCDPGTIKHAFTLLADHAVVLGPSADGGYYLIAMKHAHYKLFKDMTWSTHTVLAETLKRCNEELIRYALLPQKRDIDTLDDLRAEGLIS